MEAELGQDRAREGFKPRVTLCSQRPTFFARHFLSQVKWRGNKLPRFGRKVAALFSPHSLCGKQC